MARICSTEGRKKPMHDYSISVEMQRLLCNVGDHLSELAEEMQQTLSEFEYLRSAPYSEGFDADVAQWACPLSE